MIQYFPHTFLDLLTLLNALLQCWINALKFLQVFFFSDYDLHSLPGVKQPLWGVGEMFSFLSFFVECEVL
jgi:hypothetical protein